jgi:uncharacterized protein (DUF433 family)
MSAMDEQRHHYLDRISEDPRVMVGKPVVKGTRVTVDRVLAHLAETPDLDDLFAAFPHLVIEDVQACLTYAHKTVVNELDRATANQPAKV